MTKTKVLPVLGLVVLFMTINSGCCTIMSGNHQEVKVNSEPPGIVVTDSDGTSVTTPGVLTLSTKRNHTLTAKHPEYGEQQRVLKRKLNNWVFANLPLHYGIIGIPVDLLTGAYLELKPKSVTFTFEQENSQEPAENASPVEQPATDGEV